MSVVCLNYLTDRYPLQLFFLVLWNRKNKELLCCFSSFFYLSIYNTEESSFNCLVVMMNSIDNKIFINKNEYIIGSVSLVYINKKKN